MTQRWIEVNDLSSGQNSVNKNMRLEISLLRSGLCDDRDANENDKAHENVAFEDNALLRSCISKINSTSIDNAEDLDIVMLVYNLSEYSQSYSMTSGSL